MNCAWAGQLLSANPISVSGEAGGQQQTENDQHDHDLEQRQAAPSRPPRPTLKFFCLQADLL
jgi:hypothetical protein